MVSARLILCLGLSLLACATGVEARLDLPDTIGVAAPTAGEIVISEASSSPRSIAFPPGDGLTWALSGGVRQQTTIINGEASRSDHIGVTLTASALGALTIPELAVTLADGTVVRTAPLTRTVSAGDARLSGDCYAEAAFEPATAVVGQTTTLIYRCYLAPGFAVQTPGVSAPATATRLGEPTQEESTTIDRQGRRWRVVTWREPVAFTTAGTFTAGGQQEYLQVRDSFLGQSVVSRRRVAVKPATLVVSEPAQAGRPADFAGLVGSVGMTARLDRERIAAGEGTVLELTVETAMSELVRRPELPAIAGLRAYRREIAEAATAGQRRFAWDLVPTGPGNYAIPAFSLPWYDAESGTYQRATSAALTLEVLPGSARALSVGGAAGDPTGAEAAQAIE
nr:BatD family protein [Planctomycetota bacterium]